LSLNFVKTLGLIPNSKSKSTASVLIANLNRQGYREVKLHMILVGVMYGNYLQRLLARRLLICFWFLELAFFMSSVEHALALLLFLACHQSITDFEINAFLNQGSYRLLKFVSDLVLIFDTG